MLFLAVRNVSQRKVEKLTVVAALTGGLLALVILLGAGILGLLLLTTFFVTGTLVSSHKPDLKFTDSNAFLAENERTAGQVFANGGCAALIALVAYADVKNMDIYIVMMAASFASVTSDTFSSELGTVYGKRFYNCLTFKPDLKGENGVVSLEGILFGTMGATIITLIYCLYINDYKQFYFIVFAGLIGNLSDSVLGATLERKHYINNNIVNFISCLIAALVALLFTLAI